MVAHGDNNKCIKINYFVSEDWYFVSHRLDLAVRMVELGHTVYCVTRTGDYQKVIEDSGIKVIPIEVNRSGLNPFSDFQVLVRLVEIYRYIRPDIVHHVAMKPVLIGSVAAYLSGVNRVVNALAGLGYVFTSNDRIARLIKPILWGLFGFLFKRENSHLIVQNVDDYQMFRESLHISEGHIHLIRGAGLPVERFSVWPEPNEPVTAVLLARMLKSKGVGEFVEAATILKRKGVPVRMVLVGGIDSLNPTAIPLAEIEKWCSEGFVEWKGYQEDIQEIWKSAHISVLPSYREGLPKSLLEASACGRPSVTTDVPGCREIILDGINGLLVPVKDPIALAGAIERLVVDGELRVRLGRAARDIDEKEFGDDLVQRKTLSVYGIL